MNIRFSESANLTQLQQYALEVGRSNIKVKKSQLTNSRNL